MIKNKQRKRRGINVEVSSSAHKKMMQESVKHTPRKTLRAQINEFNGLPVEE